MYKQENKRSSNSDVKVKVKVKLLSCVRLFAIPWTVAYQAPPSMGFSRQECRSGLPFIYATSNQIFGFIRKEPLQTFSNLHL